MSASYAPLESLLESRSFRRLLVFSLVGHVALFLVLTFRPHSAPVLISTSPIMVNVVAAPKAAAAPPAAKKPAAKPPPPKAEPPKPKPKLAEVVIPKQPAPLPAKPKPLAEPEPAPKSAEELLAELTKKVEERNPPPEPTLPSQPGPATAMAGGPGVFDPVLSPWFSRVKVLVHSNWSGAQLCKGEPVFTLEVGEDGALADLQLAQSSGDRYCDQSAERAIRKSIPLPPPPRGALVFDIGMSLKDTL